MKTQKDIENMLESTAPKLKSEETQILWQSIEVKIGARATPSPFFSMFTVSRMSVVSLALILIVGAGSTTVAAQQSRPGDILFPVERALEEVRLALTVNDTSRASLQLEFAEERLAELRSLIGENPKTNFTEIKAEASSTIHFSGEADVFTDVTIVYIEINDRKSSFRTEAKNREVVIEEIVRRYNLPKNIVEAGLDFEVEDRASRVSDISHTNSDDKRVSESIKLLSSLVDDIEDNERKRFVNEVLNTLDFDEDSRVEVRNEKDDKRIEIRNGDERVRIREKDGEVRIDIKSETNEGDEDDDDRERDEDKEEQVEDDDSDEEEGDDDDNDRERDEDSDDNSEEEDDDTELEEPATNDDNEEEGEPADLSSIEVRVDEGKAEVRISYDNDDDKFTLPYVSRAVLVSAIAVKTGLSEDVIDENLEIEIKD